MVYKILRDIEPLDIKAQEKAKYYIDHLSKPIGSLGTLEDIVVRLNGINKEMIKSKIKKSIVIMCADNGVVDEKVSACPQEVTAIVTENFCKGITGVCALSKFYNSDLTVVDIGVKKDFNNDFIINKKVSYGTNNITKGPAMSTDDVLKAINAGIEIVDKLAKEEYNLIGTGEMGIGNTTTSAAVVCALMGMSAEEVVGMGSGLTKEGFLNKQKVVNKAIELNKPNKDDAIDVLSKVGGLDIAGLCGVFIGCAKNRIPVVIDGVISAAAALCAYRLNPLTRDFMFPSHGSVEKGCDIALRELSLVPMVNLNMRLGEGTGCPFAFNIIEAAVYTMERMASFEEAGIVKDDYIDIREEA